MRYLRRAVALDSTNIEALHQLSFSLAVAGQLDSALANEELVARRDPYYAYAYATFAQLLVLARRPAEAVARAAQGLAIDSTHAPLYWFIAEANLLMRRPSEARAAAARAIAQGLTPAPMRTLLAIAAVQEGDTVRARAELASVAAELNRKLARSPGGLSHFEAGLLGRAFAQAGQPDSAIAWTQRMSPGQRRFYATFLERHWSWDPVRDDPRFQRLVMEARLRATR